MTATRLGPNPFKPTGIGKNTVVVSHDGHRRVPGDLVLFSMVRKGNNGLRITPSNVGPPYEIQEPVTADTYIVATRGAATDTKAFGGDAVGAHYSAARRKEMEP